MKNANRLTEIRIGPKKEGFTLLDIVAERLKLSRRKAKNVIDEQRVFVNRKRVWMAKHRLSRGDTVEVAPSPEEKSHRKPNILYEDHHYLVLNKPSGVTSNGKNSLESLIRKQPGLETARAVHRLDKNTTGCLLFARNEKAFEKGITIFRKHEIKKMYHAVVKGRFPLEETTIKEEIDGKPALTGFKVLDASTPASHLLARLTTGRTHQIRKHLAAMRHPVIGDSRYSEKKLTDERIMQTPRQMLHASKMEFVQPFTGNYVRVEAPLPKDFKACLRSFGLK